MIWTHVLRTAVFEESSGPLVIHNKELAGLVRVNIPSLFADTLSALLGCSSQPSTYPKVGSILTTPLPQASSICKSLALAAAALLGQPGTKMDLSDAGRLPALTASC